MKLVLVHGINQQGRNPDDLRRIWVDAIERGAGRAGALNGIDVRLPLYGDALHDPFGAQPAALAPDAPLLRLATIEFGGGEDLAEAEAQFLTQALGEAAAHAGVGPDAILSEQRWMAEAFGSDAAFAIPMHRRLNAIVRRLERVSPFQGRLALRILKQAFDYLRTPGVDERVDAIVADALRDGPAVVVGHSLGTVVAFKLLRRLALQNGKVEVPAFVTLGSPLAILAVQSALGPVFAVPDGVGQWTNAVDRDDFVTLGVGLTRATFADGTANILDIDNPAADQHSDEGYLSDPRVAGAILAAFG